MSCSNPNCGVSTGIHEGLTFGHGKLDDYGYWQFPCRECAKKHDKLGVLNTVFEIMKAWVSQGKTAEQAEKYIIESDWLRFPAWPFE